MGGPGLRQFIGQAMTANSKVKGPASYFPSIERKYGQPVSHWLAILDRSADQKHMEQVAYLKEHHGIGHGHANALVAFHRAGNRT